MTFVIFFLTYSLFTSITNADLLILSPSQRDLFPFLYYQELIITEKAEVHEEHMQQIALVQGDRCTHNRLSTLVK